MKKQLTIRVFGKVQGVWFRKTTKVVADQLGIEGVVMNEIDGSVFIQAKGDFEQMEQFIAFCKTGPEEARVTNILVEEDDDLPDFKGFEILR